MDLEWGCSINRDVLEGQTLRQALIRNLHCTLAKDRSNATPHDYYVAMVYAVRERLIARWLRTQRRCQSQDAKRVYYLSMEYLTGRTLSNALINLELLDEADRVLRNWDSILSVDDRKRVGSGLGKRRLGPSGGLPAWIRWRRWAYRIRLRHSLRVRHLSADESKTATRSKRRTIGCDSAIPGRLVGRKICTRSSSTVLCAS